MTPLSFHFFRLAILLLTLGFCARATATETVLLGDQFLDDERSTQTLPQTAKWLYTGGPATELWVTPPPGSGQEVRMISNGNNSAMATAYFTAQGSPVTLAATGDSITLDLTAKLDSLNNSDSNLRFVLFNSAAATRESADHEFGTYSALYINTHSGYVATLNTGATNGPFNVYERNNQGNGSPFSIGTQMGTVNSATLNLKVKQPFPVRLKITRVATGIEVMSTINGVSVTRTDTTGILTSFDGLGFYFGSASLGSEQSMTVDDVNVVSNISGVATSRLADSFADGERDTQGVPSSAQWFYVGQSVAAERLTCSLPVSGKNLVFTPGGTDSMAHAYVTASGSPRALAVGESITMQANVHLDILPSSENGFRFGLFNSNATRSAADNSGGIATTGTTYNNDTGYSVWLNPGASGGFNLYQRATTATANTNPFTASTNTLLGAANTANLALTTSLEMIPRVSMTITRTSNTTLRVESAINGRNVVRTATTDGSSAANSFDTLAFFTNGTAFYDGPQTVFDEVTVIHATAIPAITSIGKIFSQTFEGSSWTAPIFSGTAATGTVSAGAFGTVNVLGSVTPSTGIKLDVNSTGLTGYWSGALNSGLVPVSNTETNLGKLTLAFDLITSAVRPVCVRIESADAGGTVGGALEKTIYPAVPGSFQRYAFELSTMTAASGTFSPTAPNVKLTFQIEGGVDAGSWPAGTHSLKLDNVYYAKPAYYVKPGGAGSQNGLTEANAFSSIATALAAATNAGDIIVIMESGSPSYNLSSGLAFSGGGTPGGWVTLKNYPGHSPLIKRLEPTTGSYDIIVVGKISGTVEYVKNYNYIEIRGLRWTGTADTLAVADRGGSTAKSNLNGLSAAGRATIKAPHHIRFADNEIYNISAGGISGIDIDWWYVENNDIHDTSNWTIYGTSGISQLTPSTFDGTAGTYRTLWLGNKSYRNETKIAWAQIGQISDGNGAILDTFLTTRHGPYLGRSIVANNQFFENGGSGIHALYVNGADIINNTAVRNSNSPALTYPNIFAQSSNDVVIANNIIVASTNEPINNATYTSAFPFTSGVTYLNNIYKSDGSTNTPYVGPNDSGNITTTDVKFVNDASGSNDYRLRSGSPAFNAAFESSDVLPIRDFYGILRGTDGLPDIGACEQQPAIINGPLTQSIAAGSNVTLSVAAQSAGSNSTLTYQWQRNSVNISGATNSSLVLTGVSLAQAGDYRAVVSVGSPAFDTVTSPVGTLTLQTPYPTATALTSSANPANYNASVTFTATVTSAAGIPAGSVTFFDGAATLGTAAINASGVGTLVTTNLTGGNHSITATYGAASNYSASTSSAVSQTIQSLATTTTLTSSSNPSGFGTGISFTATVTGGSGIPAGTVTFKDGAVTLGTGALNGSGIATFSINNLSVGSHSITAVYGGNANFLSSTSSALGQVIQPLATATALGSNFTPANFGASVTFTATVTSGIGTPGGSVTFKDGAVTLGTGTLNGSGVATFSINSLSIGSHSITAVYGGNANFLSSTSSALGQVIQPLATTTALSSNTNPSSYGTSITFTATVTSGFGTPGGSVTFLDGAATLGSSALNGSGVATFSISNLSGGSHEITAAYGGNANYLTSTSSTLLQSIEPIASATALTSSANPAGFGASITFTAAVTSGYGTPAGTVTFKDGAATLGTGTLNVSGVATFSISSLSAGSHSITAVYEASLNHLSSTSAAVSQVIHPLVTATALASGTNPASPGTAVTLTATVTAASGTPAGTVTFLEGANVLGTDTLNAGGTAVLTTSALASGSHALSASFGAAGNFAASVSAVLNQTIRHATTTVLASNVNPAPAGTSVTFTATVSSALAGASGLVAFSEGAVALGTATLDGSGIATFTTSTLAVGTHPITASYPGDATHESSTSNQITETIEAAITAYEAWRAAFFSPADLAVEARSGPLADPDGDGYQNLMEYAFNTDPLLAGRAGLPVAGRDANGQLYLSFNRLREDVTYRVEVGSNLTAWTTLATDPGTLGQNVLVTDAAPLETTVRFLRLRVIR